MPATAILFNEVDALCAQAAQINEESFRLTAEGIALDSNVAKRLLQIRTLIGQLGLEAPNISVGEESIDDGDLLQPDSVLGQKWRMVLAKPDLASQFSARPTEDTVLFLSVAGFQKWVEKLDPFTKPGGYSPDFSGPTTIRVRGLVHGFGGPSLWVLPLEGKVPTIVESQLPEDAAVHELVHINADELIRIRPQAWALNWGDLASTHAAAMCRLSAMVLSTCLVQEIRREQQQTQVTLRGTKRLSLPLVASNDAKLHELLPCLIETVEWVYCERPETRLKLIMDRLSIDIDAHGSLLAGMRAFLCAALQQARDSYTFVILDRKDAYHKEMRELMKDMKSQADLYAAKVRELVTSLTRDILGILVLVGFSFIGKFDPTNLNGLLISHEFSLLSKVLAGYLVLSCALVLLTTERDAAMAYTEIKKWLEVLQNYTSRADYEERFISPVNTRRRFLWGTMVAVGCIYVLLALLVWNLSFVIKLLLAQQ